MQSRNLLVFGRQENSDENATFQKDALCCRLSQICAEFLLCSLPLLLTRCTQRQVLWRCNDRQRIWERRRPVGSFTETRRDVWCGLAADKIDWNWPTMLRGLTYPSWRTTGQQSLSLNTCWPSWGRRAWRVVLAVIRDGWGRLESNRIDIISSFGRTSSSAAAAATAERRHQ